VRATTLRATMRLLPDAGAAEIHLVGTNECTPQQFDPRCAAPAWATAPAG